MKMKDCYVVKEHVNRHYIYTDGTIGESLSGNNEYSQKVIAVSKTLAGAMRAMEEYFDPEYPIEDYTTDQIVGNHYYGKRRVEYVDWENGIRTLVTLAIQGHRNNVLGDLAV